jgi:hypothetical protein
MKTAAAGARAPRTARDVTTRASRRRAQVSECILVPALGVLPWSVAWPMMRWMAQRGGPFDDAAQRAAEVADTRGFVGDRREWLGSYRLTRIVDQVDPVLAALRGDRWMDRHLVVEGDPLPRPPCVLVGFHYGAGFWTLRHLRRHAHRVAFVSARVDSTQAPGEPLRLALMRRRIAWIERAGGAPVIFVGGSTERIRAALRTGTSILGMVDVPQPPSAGGVERPFLDGMARFPDGLVRLAAAEGVPIIAYLPRLDRATGDRRLTLTRLPAGAEDSMRALVAMLDRAVREDPAAWHLWAHWPWSESEAAPGTRTVEFDEPAR